MVGRDKWTNQILKYSNGKYVFVMLMRPVAYR
jgi:hypothetical protein